MKNCARLLTLLFLTTIALNARADYSVGFRQGFTDFANHLDHAGGNRAGLLFANPPDGIVISKWNNNGFVLYEYLGGSDWDPVEPVINPGEAAFLQTSTPFTNTFTGAAHTPVLPLSLAPGRFYFVSDQLQQAGTYESIVGLSPVEGSQVLIFNRTNANNNPNPSTGTNYFTHTFRQGTWQPAVPSVPIGGGAFIIIQTNLPPVITSQPHDSTNAPGTTATFSVTASGSQPFSYQWQFNGTNLSGATDAALILSNVVQAVQGSYRVIVTNVYGAVTSAVAKLTVLLGGGGGGQYTIVNVIPNAFSGETDQNGEPSIAVKPTDPKQALVTPFSRNTIAPATIPRTPHFPSVGSTANWNFDPAKNVIPNGDQTFDWSPGGLAYGAFLEDRPAGLVALTVRPSANPVAGFGASFAANGQVDCVYSNAVPDGSGGWLTPDQPWVFVQQAGLSDRIYVAFNDLSLPTSASASVLFSLDSGATWTAPLVVERMNKLNAASVRVAASADRVYVAFERYQGVMPNGDKQGDVIVVRDDNAGLGAGGNRFNVLGANGSTVASGVSLAFCSFANAGPYVYTTNGSSMGHQDLGSDLSIAIDPRNQDLVYVAYARGGPAIHVVFSADGGASWQDVYTVPRTSAMPALAVATNGTVALLYTAMNGANLETRFLQAASGFSPVIADNVLCTFPDDNPRAMRHPYIGDYEDVQAVGNTLYGTFSASNDPNPDNFPQGVYFQRNVIVDGQVKSNFVLTSKGTLADTNGLGINRLQVPDTSTNGLDVLAATPNLLADDFLCNTSGPIPYIKVWGSWLSNVVASPFFTLYLWSDVPRSGTNASHPGALLWQQFFDRNEYATNLFANVTNESFYAPDSNTNLDKIIGIDNQVWEYTFNIPATNRFTQTNGTIYWLGVRAGGLGGGNLPRFGWKTCPTNWNDDAVFGHVDGVFNPQNDWMELRRLGTTNSLDLAFAIGVGPTVSIDPYFFSTAVKPNQNAKWSQLPGYLVSTNTPDKLGADRESNLIGEFPGNNRMVADDFVFSGSLIRRVRWWGSYLNGNDYLVEDGYVLSFFEDKPASGTTYSSPDTNISTRAVYLAPITAVRACNTGWKDCDGHYIYQYEVDLVDTCLSMRDPAYGKTNGFVGNTNSVYWLSIAAYAGAGISNNCTLVLNTNSRPSSIHYWGWHTSPMQNIDVSVTGKLLAFTNNFYVYGQWASNAPVCTNAEIDQAFVLYNDPGTVVPLVNISTNNFPNAKWGQRPNTTATGMDVLATAGSASPIVADDFRCLQTGAITDVHIWGSWLFDTLDANARFRLKLWRDVPTVPSRPGQELWSQDFTNGPAGAPFACVRTVVASGIECERFYNPQNPAYVGNDTTVYRYDFYIPTNQAYVQTSNTVYWLSVTAITTPTNFFGWKTAITNDHQLDDAVFSQAPPAVGWTEMKYPANHLYYPVSMDMAFVITSVPVPPNTNTPARVVDKWLQIPDITTSGLDVRATVPKILADDFQCRTSGPITQIKIWASWLNDFDWPGPQFRLGIWSDVQRSGTNTSHPGTPLWTNYFSPGQYSYEFYAITNENFFDPNLDAILGPDRVVWQYTFDIAATNACYQLSNTIYWLSVVTWTDPNTNYLFGWKTCPTNWNDDAVFGHVDNSGNLLGDWQELHRPGVTNSLDLSFVITTTLSTNVPPTNPPPVLTIVRSNLDVVITWTGGGNLQVATDVIGPYTNVIGATSPYVAPSSAPRRFYRVFVP